MKNKRISVIIILIGILIGSYLRADDPPSANPSDADGDKPKIIFRKSESYKFSGLMLKGQLKKPELSYIYKRKGLRAEKIVNIPEDFNDEIIQGAGQF